MIEALRNELGFALVIATHDPDVAARADRAVALAGGRQQGMTRDRDPSPLSARARGLVRSPGRTVLRIVWSLLRCAARRHAPVHRAFAAHGVCQRRSPGAARLAGAVASHKQDLRVAKAVARQPGSPAGIGDGDGAVREPEPLGPAGNSKTSQGAVLAVPPGYGSHIHTFRLLNGSLRPGGVLLDQQTGGHCRRGLATRSRSCLDPARLAALRGLRGRPDHGPDQVSLPLNPSVGPAPAQPPGNAVIWRNRHLPADAGPVLPRSRPQATANSQPGAQKVVGGAGQSTRPAQRRQLSAAEARRSDALAGGAFAARPGAVRRQSLRLAQHGGRDSLHAQALYILLAVPGALVASGSPPRRARHQ